MNAIALAVVSVAAFAFLTFVIGLVVSITGRLADARVATANQQRDRAIESATAHEAALAKLKIAVGEVITDNANNEAEKETVAIAAAETTDLAGVADLLNSVLAQPTGTESARVALPDDHATMPGIEQKTWRNQFGRVSRKK